MKPRPARWRRAFAVLGVSVLVLSVPFVLIGELPGERWLSARDAHAPAFAAFGMLLLASDVLLPIPSSVIGVMLGGRLGVAFGFVCALLGLVVGHGVGYWLGRLAPARWVTEVPGAPSWLAVFASRSVPVLAEALAVAAGATRMRWWPFFVAALLGDAIYAAALAATGAALLPGGWYVTALLAPMVFVVVAAGCVRRLGRSRAGSLPHASREAPGREVPRN
jgi:uncharacterized membrane protein YdjX (TVP38/TMEM64 family)